MITKDQAFSRDSKDTKAPIKKTQLDTYSDVLGFLKGCKEVRDYLTLGTDKKNVKASIHGLLKLVAPCNLQLKEFIQNELETSGLKTSTCLSERFPGAVEKSIVNQTSSFIFLNLVNRQPTMKDFCFRLRCIALDFISLPDLVQKPKVESNVRLLSHYLDGVIQRLRSVDEGGSLYLVLQAVEKALVLISDLFLMVFGSQSPAGSEVPPTHSGHLAGVSVLPGEGPAAARAVGVPLHGAAHGGGGRPRQGRLQLPAGRDRPQLHPEHGRPHARHAGARVPGPAHALRGPERRA